MPTHVYGNVLKTDAGSVPFAGTTYVVNAEINTLLKVAAGATNTPYLLSFPHTKVNDYSFSVATQTAAQALTGGRSEATAGTIVAKFNDSGSPVPTITIVAKVPAEYAPCLAQTTNLFTADVTEVFLSNAGAADLYLEVHVGLNL